MEIQWFIFVGMDLLEPDRVGVYVWIEYFGLDNHVGVKQRRWKFIEVLLMTRSRFSRSLTWIFVGTH